MDVDVLKPVFLLSMPRSGSTWLSQIVESSPDFIVRLSPPFSYDFQGSLNKNSTQREWREVLRKVSKSNDPFLTQNWRRDTGELCRFDDKKQDAARLAVKDTRFHNLYLSALDVLPDSKIIYLVRHPGAALMSWKNCKEFPAGEIFRDHWKTGYCRKKESADDYWGFGDWLNLTISYVEIAKKHPSRILIVRYEDLVSDTYNTAERIFKFTGLALKRETRNFINESQLDYDPRPYSIFKGSKLSHKWRNEIEEDILKEIELVTREHGLEMFLEQAIS